jgi:hypothetical protein
MIDQDMKNRFAPAAVLRLSLWAGVVAPAIFLFFAIQYSAITVPFWDHCELGRLMIKIHDTGFRWSYLWAPHTHTRPLTYRGVLLWNAWLTNWDIRSEYVYLIASIYGAFLLQAFTLRRITRGKPESRFLAALFVLSILCFSPAGHNNHWWSMMIQLDFANWFILWALVSVALGPGRWRNVLLSAAGCWLATYTISNGLIAAVAAALLSQTAEAKPLRLTRRSVFWIVNTVVLGGVYMSGMSGTEVAHRPGPGAWLAFVFVYLGSPLGALIQFPYRSATDLPRELWLNALAGVGVVAAASFIAYLHRGKIRQRTPASLLFIGFTLFALGSAALTAWGRAAFDDNGVANANGSRYTIFSSYLLFGILYFVAAHAREAGVAMRRSVRLAGVVAFVCLAAMAVRTYAHSVVVYRDAHHFNNIVSMAYTADHTEQDMFVYPKAEVVAELKAGLKRLHLGPYRAPAARASTPDSTSAALRELATNSLEDTFHIDGLRTDPEIGEILFAHPTSRFGLSVSHETKAIEVDFGIMEKAILASPPTDGVEFRIVLEGPAGEKLLWSRMLRPTTKSGDRGSQHLNLPLHADTGDKVLFETYPGPTSENDWAYWTNLAVNR